jgi:hypothetical protein
MDRQQNWLEIVNEPDKASELDDLRSSVQRGRPFGTEDWMKLILRSAAFGLDCSVDA